MYLKSLKSWCHKQYGQYVIKCVVSERGLTTAGWLSSALKKLDKSNVLRLSSTSGRESSQYLLLASTMLLFLLSQKKLCIYKIYLSSDCTRDINLYFPQCYRSIDTYV